MMAEPNSKKMTYAVLFIHTLLLGMILFGSPFSKTKPQRKALIVKTITSKPAMRTKEPVQTIAPAPAKAILTSAKPQPAPKPKPKIEAPKPVPKPAAAPTAPNKSSVQKKEPAIANKQIKKDAKPAEKKEVKNENRAKISDQLKKQLEESIVKIEAKQQAHHSKSFSSNSISTTPIQLQIDLISAEFSDSDYPNEMTAHLHNCLHLPEFGEVKIQLTLRQDGSVAKLVVLRSESERNKRYLESSLPKLQFPSFTGSFAKKKDHTFILTFCNEI